MASRRTRIKTIANIPQRRKGTNGNSELQVDEKQEDNSVNLTSSTTIDGVENGIDQVAPTTNINIEVAQREDTQSNNKSETIIVESKPVLTSVDTEITKPGNVEVQIEKEPIVEAPKSARRKFLKPTVAVNSINRKVKKAEDEEYKDTTTNKDNNNTQAKIVLLDQTIFQQAQVANVNHSNSNSEIHTIDNLEYPIPPPSPNKNRSRIKAVPRFSQRHTSFSASESEDEYRKNNRNRNDSVCSTTSGVGSIHEHIASIAAECPSPKKPKEFNTLIQKKCRRTEQSRKLAEARRDFQLKFGNNKPDRQKLTMIDLIFYNPTTNLMSHETKRKPTDTETTENEKSIINNVQEVEEEEKVDDVNNTKSGSDEENEIPAPQIKIGPQGELVVDEQSLVIENKANKKNWEALQNSKLVDGNFDTGYGVYKRAKRSKDWTKEETLKFYKALNTIGTDFSLMCEFFPRRSRRELKMKFKKEERINKALVDRAVMEPSSFNFNQFKLEVEMEEKQLAEIERQKQLNLQLKKETGRKRNAPLFKMKPEPKRAKPLQTVPKPKKRNTLNIMNVLTDSDADDEIESEHEDDDGEEDAEEQVLKSIQKPTRSGRIPKILNKYQTDPTTWKKDIVSKPMNNHEPGSLMVVGSRGPNGEPVFKVFMVTGDENSKDMGESREFSSMAEALSFQNADEGGRLKSIFTLTAEENNVTIAHEENEEIEENNFTIVEDAPTSNITEIK